MTQTSRYNLVNRIKNYFKAVDIPVWFKILNLAILIPVLLCPFVFFTTIFFFDNPKNLFLTFLLFIAVNAYPVYLALLAYGNYKLFHNRKFLALVLPLTFLLALIGGTIYVVPSVSKNLKQAEEVSKQKEVNGDLGLGYRKDKLHVYSDDTIIKDADPATFEMVNWQWQKDSKSYFYQGKLVPYIDYATFQYLDYHYAKDKNNVYYNDKIIEGADAKTTVLFPPGVLLFKLTSRIIFDAPSHENGVLKSSFCQPGEENFVSF